MSSIIRGGGTFHGISVFGRGVFTNDKNGGTYAGQHRGGYACGLGVTTWRGGAKVYAEHGPDGKDHGRCLVRRSDGDTFYFLFERGKRKELVIVYADGDCVYNCVACAPDDPRVLSLIAQVAPVEVRPAAAAAHPPSPPTRPHAIVRWIGRLVLPPQALAAAVATEVHPPRRTPSLVVVRHNPTAAALQSTTAQSRVHGPISRSGLTEYGHPRTPTHTRGPAGLSASSPCRAQHAAARGGLLTLRTPRSFPRALLAGRCSFDILFRLAGRGGRGQPASAPGGARELCTARRGLVGY